MRKHFINALFALSLALMVWFGACQPNADNYDSGATDHAAVTDWIAQHWDNTPQQQPNTQVLFAYTDRNGNIVTIDKWNGNARASLQQKALKGNCYAFGSGGTVTKADFVAARSDNKHFVYRPATQQPHLQNRLLVTQAYKQTHRVLSWQPNVQTAQLPDNRAFATAHPERQIAKVWQLATTEHNGQLYLVRFTQAEQIHTLSLVYWQPHKTLWYDFNATQLGDDIWHLDDNGEVDPHSFGLMLLAKDKKGSTDIAFEWHGTAEIDFVYLTEQNGKWLAAETNKLHTSF